MHGLYEEFRNGGFPNLIIVFFGLIGLILGIASIAVAASRGRAARTLGIACVGVAIGILSIGALGVMKGRNLTDSAISGASIDPTQKERIQREGYSESRSCAKFGIGCAAIPLIAGAIAILLGSRRREGDAESTSLAIPGALFSIATLVALGDATLLAQKLPGRDLAMDDPTWQLLSAKDQIDAGDLKRGCDQMELMLGATSSFGVVADPKQVPDFDRVAGACVDARIDAALKAPESLRREALNDVLQSTKPAMLDEAHKKRLTDEIAKLPALEPIGLGTLGLGGGALNQEVRAGALQVNGRLPPEVIQRILRMRFKDFRACYETGRKASPTLEGTVITKFVIDRTGAVTLVSDAQSTLSDKTVIACIQAIFKTSSFPEPEGGIVAVVYPLTFTAPTAKAP